VSVGFAAMLTGFASVSITRTSSKPGGRSPTTVKVRSSAMPVPRVSPARIFSCTGSVAPRPSSISWTSVTAPSPTEKLLMRPEASARWPFRTTANGGPSDAAVKYTPPLEVGLVPGRTVR